MSIETSVPAELVAGDTWRWTRDLPDYPAGTWALTYYFECPAGEFSVAATTDGTVHSVTIAATDTAGYAPGRYRWFARAVSGAIVETVAGEEGWLQVTADPAATGKRDWRSDARKMLDAVTATLLGRATSDQLAMSLNGRSISRTPLSELREWKTQLEAEVRTEELGDRAGLGRDIRVRMVRG